MLETDVFASASWNLDLRLPPQIRLENGTKIIKLDMYYRPLILGNKHERYKNIGT
jgi:hypothetical protein